MERLFGMRLGITTFGADGGTSGIGQYLVYLLREFARYDDDTCYEVLTYPDERPIFVPDDAPLPALQVSQRVRPPLLNIAWHHLVLPRLCRQRQYDALFLPAANRRAMHQVPCPTVGTVHDLSALHVQDKYDPARMLYITRVLPHLIRRLTSIITVSESSKQDIVHAAGVPEERVHVIPLAADPQVYFPREKAEARARVQTRYGTCAPYILYTSRIEHPGKNHVRLIKAFVHWKTTQRLPHQLVLAGSDWTRAEEVHRAIRTCRYADDIVCTGFVPAEELPWLYSGAELFMFPSLYEGFGLPILEAMCCGVPVACADRSSMPEVGGDAAYYFDPYDVDALAEAMDRLGTDTSLRNHLVQRGLVHSRNFRWKDTASSTLEVIRKAAAIAPR